MIIAVNQVLRRSGLLRFTRCGKDMINALYQEQRWSVLKDRASTMARNKKKIPQNYFQNSTIP